MTLSYSMAQRSISTSPSIWRGPVYQLLKRERERSNLLSGSSRFRKLEFSTGRNPVMVMAAGATGLLKHRVDRLGEPLLHLSSRADVEGEENEKENK